MRILVIIFLVTLSYAPNGFSQVGTRTFFEKLDLDKPELHDVKFLLIKNKLARAEKALLKVYRMKENTYIRSKKGDIAYIKKSLPGDSQSTIEAADRVCNKNFLFQYEWDMEKTIVPYQFTNEINWQLNPFGDKEWTWMLNRHRYWTDLGKAYLLTDNEKYVKAFVSQAVHWIDNNPLNDETKSTSWRSLEVGFRMENWIKTFESMKYSKHITPKFFVKFLNSLVEQAEYLNSFTYDSCKSNWGVIINAGLFNAASFLSEFKSREIWINNAVNALSLCSQHQILEDGTQIEQSTMYHNEVMRIYLNVIMLSDRLGVELPETINNKIYDMAFANIEWQKPNYNQPLLGDSDDNDIRGLLTMASLLYKNPLLKSRAFNSLDFENYFLFGRQQDSLYQSLKVEIPSFLSAFQKSAGDLYSRTSWDEDAFYSALHLRRLGTNHSHDNLLHFSLFAHGRDYLVDTGRYTYVDNEWREYFKSNMAHNTLGVDNLTNSIYNHSWNNTFEATSEGVLALIEDDFDYAEATNKAYMRLNDPVLLKRRMLYLKPDVWLLVDSYEADDEHNYTQYFNFSNQKVEIENGGLITTYNKDNLRIQPINEVTIKLEDAWWSPHYNFKEETTRAILSRQTKGFNSFLTLLYFPENQNVSYEKLPIYNLKDRPVPNNLAEAVKLTISEKEYILIIKHEYQKNANTQLVVDGQVVSDEVVLIDKSQGDSNVIIIK
ncbi:heparinase II/III-like protein [Arenibacter algicola]|uniref:Heparinase II/III-like protein n=1 Tax=Arenibacter algicola TaxID=616991 RepID=A0ABY3AI59_9FLAO